MCSPRRAMQPCSPGQGFAGWFCGAAGKGRAVHAVLLSAFSGTWRGWRDWSGRTLHPPASSCNLLHPPASSCILLQHEIISASSSLASAPANFLTGSPRGHDAPARTWAQGPLPSPLHLYQGTWHVCPGISDAPTGFCAQPQKPQRAPMTLSPAWSPVN